jgi:hypothetical protein
MRALRVETLLREVLPPGTTPEPEPEPEPEPDEE